MKKKYIIIVFFLACISFFNCNSQVVSAKRVVASKTITDIFGNSLGTIGIYDNAEINIGYKYGLRKATLYYCVKGENCDANDYTKIEMMEASKSNPYKNQSEDFLTFTYRLHFEDDNEYRIRVEAYFGSNNGYSGIESLSGSYTLTQLESLDTSNTYIQGSNSSSDYGDEEINNLMSKITLIINTVVLPIIYTTITFFFVIKGAVLGVQIVKSADSPDIRAEKVHALKWLVIGVAITYLASSIVGVITGFFESLF